MTALAANSPAQSGNLAAGYFPESEQLRQRADDTSAWWAVCTVLLAVVSCGVLGMALTVLWVLAH
ncbi:MAG: hypothetical protein AB7O62_01900 [Pirellulales bacterium]